MTAEPDSDAELELLRSEHARAFSSGWLPTGVGEPRVLTEHAYATARQFLGHGGWTGLDAATIQAVREGAQPGDPLPPLPAHPYIDDVTDAEVVIIGSGRSRRVAVLFSYRRFPGLRFGHRFSGYDPSIERVGLKEEIETGALDRMMQHAPAADDAGIIWTSWEDEDQDAAPGQRHIPPPVQSGL